MAEKADYSPVVEEAGDAEKRRERRKWGAFSPARTSSESTQRSSPGSSCSSSI
jgi:hypothetical protein